MSDIAHIVLSDGTSYDIKDAVARGSGFHSVKGTQTSSTSSWTGSVPLEMLQDGVTIAYYLPQSSGPNATLNLTLTGGDSGPVNVYYQDSTRMGTQFPAGTTILLTYWSAGSIIVNGSPTSDNRWVLANSSSQIYTQAYCESGGDTSQKSALCSGYVLRDDAQIMVVFTNTNTAESALTLNINGTGSFPIYINGSVSSSSNFDLPAGSYLVVYHSDAYHIYTDGSLPINITGTAGYVPIDSGHAIAGSDTNGSIVSPKALVDAVQARSPSHKIKYHVDSSGLLEISDPYAELKLIYFGYNYARPSPDRSIRKLIVVATGSSDMSYTWYRNVPGSSQITEDATSSSGIRDYQIGSYSQSNPLQVYCVVTDNLQNQSVTTETMIMYP